MRPLLITLVVLRVPLTPPPPRPSPPRSAEDINASSSGKLIGKPPTVFRTTLTFFLAAVTLPVTRTHLQGAGVSPLSARLSIVATVYLDFEERKGKVASFSMYREETIRGSLLFRLYFRYWPALLLTFERKHCLPNVQIAPCQRRR